MADEQTCLTADPERQREDRQPLVRQGALWVVVPVGRIPGDYQLAFSMTMLACLVATALAALVAARRLGLSPARQALAVGVVALTPVLLAALGGAICAKAGVFNVGLEGFMLVGAFAATNPVQGVDIKSTLFDTANSVVSGSVSEQEWQQMLNETSNRLSGEIAQ